jgi:hypothetical protein
MVSRAVLRGATKYSSEQRIFARSIRNEMSSSTVASHYLVGSDSLSGLRSAAFLRIVLRRPCLQAARNTDGRRQLSGRRAFEKTYLRKSRSRSARAAVGAVTAAIFSTLLQPSETKSPSAAIPQWSRRSAGPTIFVCSSTYAANHDAPSAITSRFISTSSIDECQ